MSVLTTLEQCFHGPIVVSVDVTFVFFLVLSMIHCYVQVVALDIVGCIRSVWLWFLTFATRPPSDTSTQNITFAVQNSIDCDFNILFWWLVALQEDLFILLFEE